MLSPSSLINRWTTPAGAAIRIGVIEALAANQDLRVVLRRLPGADEVFDWLDLRGIDLSGLTIRTNEFVAASLDFACLDRCHFKGAILDNASLLYTAFNHATFSRTQMQSVKALHASFDGANFNGVLAMNADLSYGSFHGAVIVNSDFGKCRCACTTFSNSALHEAKFDEATLGHVNFSGARASNCSFKDTTVFKTVLPSR